MIDLLWPVWDKRCALLPWQNSRCEAKIVMLSIPKYIVSSGPGPLYFMAGITNRCPAAFAQGDVLVRNLDKIFTNFP